MIRLKHKALAAAIVLAASATPVNASLNDQMASIFGEVGSMANVTAPDTYKSMSRGGIAFGGIQVRNKIINQNIVSWVPPSVEAGCGGIDMNMGSFSFINGDQIVETLRAVAANAKGYAFQVALNAVAPDLAGWIEVFQKKMQSLNQYLGNSCQLASGIVTNTQTSIKAFMDGEENAFANWRGVGDAFQTWTTKDWKPKDKLENPLTKDYIENMRGNLVYKVLNTSGTRSAFKYGDRDLLETIVSLTGSIVISKELADTEQSNITGAKNPASQTSPIDRLPPLISLEDFVFGGVSGSNIKIYRCDSEDKCLKSTAEPVTDFVGFYTRVKEVLTGKDGNPGVINKYRYNMGALTDQEKAVMLNLPDHLGSFIVTLSTRNHSAANTFANKAALALAVELSYEFVEAAHKAVETAVHVSDNPFLGEFRDTLRDRKRDLQAEYERIKRVHNLDLDSLMSQYRDLLNVTEPKKYIETEKDIKG